jgi:Tfp pilus assembly protein PilX
MQKPFAPFSILKNEQGFVLVMAMVALLMLVVVGISVMNTTSVEVEIAGNEKFHKMAFYNADSGVYATPKIISRAIEAGGDPVEGPSVNMYGVGTTVSAANAFYNEIMGFVASDAEDDLEYTLVDQQVGVDVIRFSTEILAGGGAEFAAGSAGVGSGSTGGIAINYNITSTGSAPGNSTSTVSARYRKVPGTAGGL